MMRLPVLAAMLLVATPAFADNIVLTVDNKSSQAVLALDAYPVADDGSIIEDNIGGFMDDLPPGETAYVTLQTLTCETIFVRLVMADETELRTNLETCRQALLTVTD